MGIVDDIAAIRARLDLSKDEKRPLIYALKAVALIDVIVEQMLGRFIKHSDYRFRINAAQMTTESALFLDVTFKRARVSVTHQITIVNPPVLPRARTGNERRDLKTAIHEMLEGFV